jgi:cobyrinic acid a,c-diamide synthase
VCGVVLNRVGSERHRLGATVAIEAVGLPVLGALPRDPSLSLPERHLGLVQAAEHPDLPDLLHRLADKAEQCLDLHAILRHAAPVDGPAAPVAGLRPPGQCVALAADAAFGFIYAHLVQGWRRAGAEIVRFSPLADEPPPERCDVCWLPGGYPELHAARLAGAGRFMAGLARFAETRPVHGECGGHMVLGQGIEDAAGARHARAGLLGHETSFARRRLHLGYREATLLADAPIGAAGAVVRGHEFHYVSTVDPGKDAPLATLRDAGGASLGEAGGRRGHVTGSFFHVIAAAA